MKTEDKYFFCYSTNLQEFLRYEKGIKYVHGARHLTTNRVFWLYERTEELKLALSEYNEQGKQLGYK